MHSLQISQETFCEYFFNEPRVDCVVTVSFGCRSGNQTEKHAAAAVAIRFSTSRCRMVMKHRVPAPRHFNSLAKPADRMFVLKRSPHGRAATWDRGANNPARDRPWLELPTVLAERTLPSGITHQQLPRNRFRSRGGDS